MPALPVACPVQYKAQWGAYLIKMMRLGRLLMIRKMFLSLLILGNY
jgi:hypothetical protein